MYQSRDEQTGRLARIFRTFWLSHNLPRTLRNSQLVNSQSPRIVCLRPEIRITCREHCRRPETSSPPEDAPDWPKRQRRVAVSYRRWPFKPWFMFHTILLPIIEDHRRDEDQSSRNLYEFQSSRLVVHVIGWSYLGSFAGHQDLTSEGNIRGESLGADDLPDTKTTVLDHYSGTRYGESSGDL